MIQKCYNVTYNDFEQVSVKVEAHETVYIDSALEELGVKVEKVGTKVSRSKSHKRHRADQTNEAAVERVHFEILVYSNRFERFVGFFWQLDL
jgi:hypothetical protein